MDIEKVLAFFKELASMLEGKLLYVDDYPYEMIILKDDLVIRYQIGVSNGRVGKSIDYNYILMLPFDLGEQTITIKKKMNSFLAGLSDEVVLKDYKDYTVRSKHNKETHRLIELLMNDFEFKNALNKKLKFWELKYEHQTISCRGFKSLNAFNGDNVVKEDFLDAYELMIEFKKALEFHSKRMHI